MTDDSDETFDMRTDEDEELSWLHDLTEDDAQAVYEDTRE